MDSPVWFITGATSGFGLEIAKEALRRNHKVIATGRNATKLAELSSLGATARSLDVTAPERQVQAVVEEAHTIHGKITHVVNAAGYILDGLIEEADADEVLALYDANLFGAIKVCRAVAPLLRAQGYGVVANFGSIGSWRGLPASASYCASKAAVSGTTEGLAAELKPFGIDVCCVEPGYFRTAFLNEGYRKHPAVRIPAYSDGPAGELLAAFEKYNNQQPGDPVKGARVAVDVFTQSGPAKGRGIPVRLALGTDALAVIRKKCNDTLALLKEWEDLSSSTDFVNVK